MARGDIKHYEVDWDKFCQFVIERWRNKIIERDVYDTGNLYRSLTYNYRGTNSLNQTVGRGSGATLKIPDMVSFSFPMYGIYVEKGVGRGYTRGNGGTLVKFEGKGRGRERRTWYYRIFAHERKVLGDLVAQQYGRAAARMIRTIEMHSISRSRNPQGAVYASLHT